MIERNYTPQSIGSTGLFTNTYYDASIVKLGKRTAKNGVDNVYIAFEIYPESADKQVVYQSLFPNSTNDFGKKFAYEEIRMIKQSVATQSGLPYDEVKDDDCIGCQFKVLLKEDKYNGTIKAEVNYVKEM